MKAATVAVAAAGLLGSVAAHQGHAHLHARGAWDSSASTSKTTVQPASSSSSANAWDPKKSTTTTTTTTKAAAEETWSDWSSTTTTTTTTKSKDPVTTTSEAWGDWSSTTTTTTTTKAKDPATTSSEAWGDWSSTTTTTTTKAKDPATTSSEAWGDWSSTTTTTKAKDPATTSSEAWGDWEAASSSSSKAKDPTGSSSAAWSEWSAASSSSSSSKAKDPTGSSSMSWGEWDDAATTTVMTKTSTVTVTVWPVGSKSDSTVTGTTTVSKTATATSGVVTKTVDAVWSSDGWFGPSWTADAAGQCSMNVISSYGMPVWKPTPAAPTTTASDDWSEWNATSSSSSKKDGTTSSSATTTWADWSSASASSSTTTSSKKDGVTSAASSWAASTGKAGPSGGGFWSASSSSSAAWSSPSKSSSGISSNGNKFGMTYSPYTSSGGCKDAWTVDSDIAKLAGKGFSSVRVYSTDCSTLQNVGTSARKYNLKMIIGVFISETGIAGAAPQVQEIVSWAQWDLVELIVVGNEAVFQGRCSAGDLAGFIQSSKASFKAAGYQGLVTTTEELSVWQSQGSAWCDSVDVVAANLYAFFNADTTADKAGDLIQAQIKDLGAICPGKDTYVMESGWPSAGNCNGAACPSPENQATALKGIMNTSGAKVVFFSFEDEAWKQPGQFGVEQHWGCADVF